MTGRLFQFAKTHSRDPAIEAWLDEQPQPLGSIARHWFEAFRRCGADVREVMHDHHPTACVGDTAFGYVNAFTAHVNIGFFHGAELPDPGGLLEGNGRFMRHVKLRPTARVDDAALRRLVQVAYEDMQKRLQ